MNKRNVASFTKYFNRTISKIRMMLRKMVSKKIITIRKREESMSVYKFHSLKETEKYVKRLVLAAMFCKEM